MKKTLIAMAAAATLATSGAAFAQATISGYMSGGYMFSTTGGATSTSTGGVGADTAELYITATEDIGGGLKAGGTYGIGGLERGAGNSAVGGTTYQVYGTNFEVFVQNAAGKFAVGSTKAGDYVSAGLASAGVNYYDFGDFGNFGARSRRDYMSLSVPLTPAIGLGLAHQEAANIVGGAAGGEGQTGQRVSAIQVSYTEGPIKLNTQYLSYDNQVANSDAKTANVFRLSGNYNLGVATIGAGLQRGTQSSAAIATNIGASVSVPLGALTLGAMIGSRTTEGFTLAGTSNAALASYSISGSYALSKRTGVTGQYINWDAAANVTNKSSMGLLFLTHSF